MARKYLDGTQPHGHVQVEILAYAPTEFFHCQHCEMTWNQIGMGESFHAEQRNSGLLPSDLMEEYAAISDWVFDAAARYGSLISIRLVDAASPEGVFKAIRHRTRHFPAFFVDGDRIDGFDRGRLESALTDRLQA